MHDLAVITKRISSMSAASIDNVRNLERVALAMPQIPIATEHVFHAGVYARTIVIPAGVILTGALIKRSTLLIIDGDAVVYMDDGSVEIHGYNLLLASANRKQAFVALSETSVTMIFATDAATTEEAENEFTDEAPSLFSRHSDAINRIFASGE